MPEDDKKDDLNGEADKKDQKDSKVTFNDEQQALLQQIVDKAYTKAFTKAEETWKAKTDSLTAQIDELKKKPTVPEGKPEADKDEAPVKDDKPADKAHPDYDALAARLDEVTTVANTLKADKEKAERDTAEERKKNKEARIKEQFFRAADKVEFFDRMDVFALIQSDLDIDDDGEVVIMNPKTKQPRISGSDPEKNLSLDQYLGEFAKAKPNMVRAVNSEGGSGAGPNRATEVVKKKDAIDYSKMKPEEFRELTNKVISRQYTQRS